MREFIIMMGKVRREGFLVGAVAVSLLLLASCKTPFESNYENRIAMVDSVATPDSVYSFQAIAVTIWSSAPNLCWRRGTEAVVPDSGGFLITAYDQEFTGKAACAQSIARFQHVVSVRFTGSGTKKIMVKDRNIATNGQDSLTTITRMVTVR